MWHPKAFLFIVLCSLFFVAGPAARAADFTIMLSDPDASGLREGALVLSTAESVNAIGGKVTVPSGVKIVALTEAQSIVSFWVEEPKWEGGVITFGGIIPGGFVGEGALFHFYAHGDSASAMAIDPEATELLANDGVATEEPVSALPATALAPQFALSGEADTNPPEVLSFKKLKLLGENDKLFVLFHTRDRESGVASSEVAYTDIKEDVASSNLKWQAAESPLSLTKNEEGKYIYLKTVDRAGNERIEVLPPEGIKDNELFLFFAILIGGAAATTFLIYVWRRRR